MRPLRVCIDARLEATAGGVRQVVVGLAHGLSRIGTGSDEFLFLVHEGEDDDWLRPYLGDACRLLPLPARPAPPRWRRAVQSARARLVRSLPAAVIPPRRPRTADGRIEQAGVEVMHFTAQDAFLTGAPSIYHPHDLQHLHLPQFFTARERRDREVLYRAFCAQARMVAVSSEWTRRDVMRQYGLPEDKVRVVPLAPPIAAYPLPTEQDLRAVRARLGLPDAFLFYPAQTWPHKNHLALVEALAHLRAQGIRAALICSGTQNSHFPVIERRVRAMGLGDQVTFVGFVSPLELQVLYRLCRAVVIPTRFESASFPIWEAFLAGAPVACSNVTALPEQAGGAALIFDPGRPEEIAAAIARLWTDGALREQLAARGRERVGRLSWERTARIFRAHYRRIAGRPLTDEDGELLSAS